MTNLINFAATMLIAATALLASGNLVAYPALVTGSNVVVKQSRALPPIQQVVVHDDIQLILKQGSKRNLSIVAEDNLHPLIVITIENRTLTISQQHRRITAHHPLQCHLQLDTLRQLTAFDNTTISSPEGLRIGMFKVALHNRANANLWVASDKLLALLHNQSNLTISGRASSQELHVAGTSLFNGKNLIGNRGTLDLQNFATAYLDIENLDITQLSAAAKFENH